MHPKDAEGIANSVDPDQTAVWSGSTLFAQTCLSENLGKSWYCSEILFALGLYFWEILFNDEYMVM